MHLLKMRVRTGTRTNLVNLITFVGTSFLFMELPSEKFSIKRTTFSSDSSCKYKDEHKVVVSSGTVADLDQAIWDVSMRSLCIYMYLKNLFIDEATIQKEKVNERHLPGQYSHFR